MTEPRILVLGITGMLGHKMFQVLSAEFDTVFGTMRGSLSDKRYRLLGSQDGGRIFDGLPLGDGAEMTEVLEELKPDIVVNCVGTIKQRLEAADPVTNVRINAVLPHVIAKAMLRWGGRVIHFSTDCVFRGLKGDYTESDPSDAMDIYGKSKYLGEPLVGNALVLRTSIIGRELIHRDSLLEWLLSMNHKQVRGFTRHWWSGVTTNHLSRLVTDIIRSQARLAGLYQVSSGKISKYDLLCLLRDAYALDVEITPDGELFCDRSLTGDLLRDAIGYVCPPWVELIEQLVKDPTEYDSKH